MQDKTVVNKRWEFDENVTKVFDDMLNRSIPNYEVMRKLVNELSNNYIKENSTIVDLGCSRGGAIESLVNNNVNVVGIEISKPMLKASREKFKNHDNVEILEMDITKEFPSIKSDLFLSILTLQFTPIEYRHKILKEIYNHLEDNGAFIFVEKVLGDNHETNKLLVDCYYDLKRENGYDDLQIFSKKKSLEGVLVPLTSKWNEDLLKQTGFKTVECFWRCLNFAGWIAIK